MHAYGAESTKNRVDKLLVLCYNQLVWNNIAESGSLKTESENSTGFAQSFYSAKNIIKHFKEYHMNMKKRFPFCFPQHWQQARSSQRRLCRTVQICLQHPLLQQPPVLCIPARQPRTQQNRSFITISARSDCISKSPYPARRFRSAAAASPGAMRPCI